MPMPHLSGYRDPSLFDAPDARALVGRHLLIRNPGYAGMPPDVHGVVLERKRVRNEGYFVEVAWHPPGRSSDNPFTTSLNKKHFNYFAMEVLDASHSCPLMEGTAS